MNRNVNFRFLVFLLFTVLSVLLKKDARLVCELALNLFVLGCLPPWQKIKGKSKSTIAGHSIMFFGLIFFTVQNILAIYQSL